ncbi:MAG: HK97 family phage prohead protease [bacterium]|nr:HK97 family phage prohead protease [bacterium]
MHFVQGYGNFQPKIELKAIDGEGFFTGYGSVFNVLDDQGDRVVSGAFQRSIQDWENRGQMPKMLWQHESKQPIGYWTHMSEDENGLYVEGRLLLDIQKAQEAYSLMQAEVLDGLSIGYRVVDFHEDTVKKERFLTEVDLHEVSLVTFAANQRAKILTLKSNDNDPEEDSINQEIQDLRDLISE